VSAGKFFILGFLIRNCQRQGFRTQWTNKRSQGRSTVVTANFSKNSFDYAFYKEEED